MQMPQDYDAARREGTLNGGSTDHEKAEDFPRLPAQGRREQCDGNPREEHSAGFLHAYQCPGGRGYMRRPGSQPQPNCALRICAPEQLAGPKKINEASCPGETVNWLLKSRDSTSGYAKNIEELIPECLLVRLLACGIAPTTREGERTMADFIPRNIRHYSSS